MICIFFTKSKLYFTRLGYLEIVKQLSGYPAWEMEYNSHGNTYTNCLAQVPWTLYRKWAHFRKDPVFRWALSLSHRLCTGHTVEIPKAECIDRILSACDLKSFWPLALKIYMKMNSSEFHLSSLFCVLPCRLSACKQECRYCPVFRSP